MKKISYIIVLIAGVLLLLTSCSESDQNTLLKVRLTDAPADYEQVLIDVQDVQIHVSDIEDQGNWQSLQVNKGVYNLLDFRNGMDTLLAYLELPAGKISQMRLVLGSDNMIKVDGELQDMDTPSAQQSGLKFNINANLIGGIVYTLWIDFDAARSVVKKGNGKFSLKPVIRTFNEATSGAISGNVSPAEALPYVMAVANGDTIGTYANESGSFLLKAIPQGIWSVIFYPVDPYLNATVDNVSVVTGMVTKMDTVYLSQQ